MYDHNKKANLERLLVETSSIETKSEDGDWRKEFVVEGGEAAKADEILLKRIVNSDPFMNFAEIYIKGY